MHVWARKRQEGKATIYEVELHGAITEPKAKVSSFRNKIALILWANGVNLNWGVADYATIVVDGFGNIVN